MKKFTRREFIRTGSAATLGGAMLLSQSYKLLAQNSKQSKVVIVRDNNLFDGDGNPNAEIVQKMLDDAVIKLTNSSNIQEAWKTLIKPEDVVGIKTNEYRYLPTPDEVEDAIEKRVLEVGVKSDNLSIDDRGILRNPVFQRSTALINTRPMRAHNWSGVGTLLKNYIMFAEVPSAYHPDSCADLAAIWKLPHVYGKTRLNVLVMFTPIFHTTGPHHFNPKYMWNYNGLIVGTDPVSVDSVGVNIIMAKRKEYFGEERPLTPPAKHIFLAETRHKLGIADLTKIDIIKLGYQEDSLI